MRDNISFLIRGMNGNVIVTDPEFEYTMLVDKPDGETIDFNGVEDNLINSK